MGKPTKFITKADIQAGKALLEHAFRNASPRSLRDVEFNDISSVFAEYRAAVATELLTALDDIMPPPLCGEAWDLPDSEKTSIVVTFGKLRAARAAIAKATGAAE